MKIWVSQKPLLRNINEPNIFQLKILENEVKIAHSLSTQNCSQGTIFNRNFKHSSKLGRHYLQGM